MNVSINNLPLQVRQRYQVASQLNGDNNEQIPPAWGGDRPTPHPSTPQWFEWKLGKVYDALRDRFFGYTYDVVSTKTLKREKNEETLVDALLCFEEHCVENNNQLPTEFLNPYHFLKLVLEKNASLFGLEEELFDPVGVRRDRSRLSLPQKNMIAVQCAAQVLWHLDGRMSPTIEAMERRLLKREPLIYQLLELNRFGSDRTIENWIRPIFPKPPEKRKRKRPRYEEKLENIIPIPGVHSEIGTNFLKLRFVAICISRILSTLEWQVDQIIDSKFISQLSNPVGSYLNSYVQDWVEEAYSSNGSIFTS